MAHWKRRIGPIYKKLRQCLRRSNSQMHSYLKWKSITRSWRMSGIMPRRNWLASSSLYITYTQTRRREYHEVIHETPIVNLLSQVIDSLYDFIPVEETDCAWMMQKIFGILYNTGFNNWRRFTNQENTGKPGWKCIKSVASKSMETMDRKPIDVPKSCKPAYNKQKFLIQLFVSRPCILIIASV